MHPVGSGAGRIDSNGDAHIGDLVLYRPVAYQQVNGERRPMTVRYRVHDRMLTFATVLGASLNPVLSLDFQDTPCGHAPGF